MGRVMDLYNYAFEKYAKFEGRACRMEYFSFNFINYLIGILAGILVGCLSIKGFSTQSLDIVKYISAIYIIVVVFGLITFIPSLALSVRRLHDVNLSGWVLLTIFLPFINLILLLMLLFAPSNDGRNNYGDPSENY